MNILQGVLDRLTVTAAQENLVDWKVTYTRVNDGKKMSGVVTVKAASADAAKKRAYTVIKNRLGHGVKFDITKAQKA